MITKSETHLLLVKIAAHHGNAKFDDATLAVWREEINREDLHKVAGISLPECSEAVTRYYVANSTGRWIMPGDVIAGVRALRRERMSSLSELELGRIEIEDGVDPRCHLTWRRRLMADVARGVPVERAREAAADAARGEARALPAVPDRGAGGVTDAERAAMRSGFIGRRRRGLSKAGSGMPPVGNMPDSASSGPADGRTGLNPSAGASQPSKPPQAPMEDPGDAAAPA